MKTIIMFETKPFSQEASLLLPTLALLFLSLIFLITKHLKNSLSKSPPLPPGPYRWPILGNILQLRNEPLYVTLARFAKTYGSDLISFKLGAQLIVVGSSRAAALEILKTHDRNLSARFVPHVLPAKSPQLNDFSIGWTFECNDSWKNLRAISRTELFSSKAIKSQACIREKKVSEMLEIIRKMQGREVNIKNVAFAVIYNMMSNILISRDLVSLEHEILSGEMGGLLRRIMEFQATPNVSDMYPFLGSLDLQSIRKRAMEGFGFSNKQWEAIVRERKERPVGSASTQRDFLDVMLQDGCSQDQINMLFPELLTAGTDSSVATVEWTMAELVKNPKCMKMVLEELTREICSRGLAVMTESDVPKLKYLEACVKETLRLHPPGPLLIPRRAAEPCTLMNYSVPKNSQVLINVWAIGRDPSCWEDPLAFKPERFLESSLDFKGNDFEFLPFGGGRRICPGLPMASKHVPLIVASLIHSFDWSLPKGRDSKELDMAEKHDVLLRKREPLILIPKTKILS